MYMYVFAVGGNGEFFGGDLGMPPAVFPMYCMTPCPVLYWEPPADGEWKLLLISQASSVGLLPLALGDVRGRAEGMKVYCIDRIAIVPLTPEGMPEVIGLDTCVGGCQIPGKTGTALYVYVHAKQEMHSICACTVYSVLYLCLCLLSVWSKLPWGLRAI